MTSARTGGPTGKVDERKTNFIILNCLLIEGEEVFRLFQPFISSPGPKSGFSTS